MTKVRFLEIVEREVSVGQRVSPVELGVSAKGSLDVAVASSADDSDQDGSVGAVGLVEPPSVDDGAGELG